MIQLKYKYECRLFLSRLSFVLFFACDVSCVV